MTMKRRVQTIETINEETYIMEGGEKVLHLRRGTIFNGSLIADNGKWATCQNCGQRHAVGLRCAACDKQKYPAKRQPRHEHRDTRKPSNIRGI